MAITLIETCPHCYKSIDIYEEFGCDYDGIPWEEDGEIEKKCPHCSKKITIFAFATIEHGIRDID